MKPKISSASNIHYQFSVLPTPALRKVTSNTVMSKSIRGVINFKLRNKFNI